MKEKRKAYVTLAYHASASLILLGLFTLSGVTAAAQVSLTESPFTPGPLCNRMVTADVVAFDQIITYNRFGAFNPAGMMYALRRDVVPVTGNTLSPGNVQLKHGKRPRPIVLRINEGDCLEVTFTNYLTPDREDVDDINFTNQPDKQTYERLPQKLRPDDEPFTRYASMHVNGLEYVDGIQSDGANVGNNASSLVQPGQSKVYKWYGRKQGQYLVHSMGAPVGNQGDGGQIGLGLFGSINVEPPGAVWYRSQLTNGQLVKATTGTTANGQPIINYAARDAQDSNRPVLNMLDGTEIVHTDVNAIITGFTENCATAPPSGTCGQPFREFTTIFHDEIKTVQAFEELELEVFHGVRDGFAINYGSQSLGAPILANRKNVGPSKNCKECKFEEFFLESWPNGDPAMVVKTDSEGEVTEVLFPDDPSNVHHSYIGDPTRFRNLHAGPKETHVFHLHAHQWLHESKEDGSTYLDSQTISPGSAFTYEINYGGSGNRNLTVGDAIFHCHLYPHFAQGMWELWRNHDVFEQGTPDRNLPDGEIAGGTPNPAVVPIPGRAMPLMPTEDFKGYPFYVAAQAGHRPPQPPIDIDNNGGLPRHRILAATVVDGQAAIPPALLTDPVAARVLSQVPSSDPSAPFLLGFARELITANVELLPPNGTLTEQRAINFHHNPTGATVFTPYGWPAKAYPSFKPDGSPGQFLVNGQPPKPGAPFAEPCQPGSPQRDYRAATIEFDMTVNRAGWHDRQARISVLEQDVSPTLNGTRPPEPFFFRANSRDCVVFKSTNLIPHVLNLDDFQIFTPTDIIGQHIHLVKFDVTASDGAANGWNYEDGAFSPGEVQERIEANNAFQNSIGGSQILTPQVHPVFGAGPDKDQNGVGDWVGAQTTTQRWWADPLVDRAGKDRTIRTVFTHDHFGPSSHQHHGLYGALVVEPTDSIWQAKDGSPLGGRSDGGPTSFQANIIWDDPNELSGDQSASYREFNLAFADFAIVYTLDLKPVNPPGRKEVGLPNIVAPPDFPQPEAISADDPGTSLLNYRNEPIPLRIGANNGSGQFVQKTGPAGDMANVFRTDIHGDPFTPILEAYEGDRVHIRLIQGAQEEQHSFSVHGMKWLHEPNVPNSGWTNAQAIGISEHFESELPPIPPVGGTTANRADFLYGSLNTDTLWNGMWSFLRQHRGIVPGLQPLPYNLTGQVASNDPRFRTDVCPPNAREWFYDVEAWLAKDLAGPNGIPYNNKFELRDPAGIVFVMAPDVPYIQSGERRIEPLVMRAGAGDCINLRLTNKLPQTMPDYDGWNFMPMLIPGFNLNQIRPSNQISLHPQLIEYDVRTSDGANIGINDVQTVGPGGVKEYRWYAGRNSLHPAGPIVPEPIEYGTVNLTDYGDIMKHGSHGAVAAFVIQPQGSFWASPGHTYTEATIFSSTFQTLYREFVTIYQDDVKMVGRGNVPVRNYIGDEDPEDSGMKAFNYRTEPLWARLGFLNQMIGTGPRPPGFTAMEEKVGSVDLRNVLSSTQPNKGCIADPYAADPFGPGLGLPCGDPATPIFTIEDGARVRFRVGQPTGHPRQHGFTIHGHNWVHEPWVANSTAIYRPGVNPEPPSMTIGTQGGHSARRHWNIVLPSAGGAFRQPGDYLFRTQESYQFTNGLWGIFRVVPGNIVLQK